MKKQFKLGVIGYNLITQTIIKGAVLSDFLHERKIVVGNCHESSLKVLDELGVLSVNDLKYVAENSEYLIIGVKAQDFENLAKSIGAVRPSKIICVSDGLKKNDIKTLLSASSAKVARALANLPSAIGSGVVAVDMSDFNSSYDDIEFISNLFDCIGTIVSVDESKLSAVCGLSVNGVAYALMFIDSLIDAGVKQGLKKSEAKMIAAQTLLGSAEMVSEEKSVSELTVLACKNGGTALEGVKILEDNKFMEIIGNAVESGVKKLNELDKK